MRVIRLLNNCRQIHGRMWTGIYVKYNVSIVLGCLNLGMQVLHRLCAVSESMCHSENGPNGKCKISSDRIITSKGISACGRKLCVKYKICNRSSTRLFESRNVGVCKVCAWQASACVAAKGKTTRMESAECP